MFIHIFQAFLKAWDAVCNGGSKGITKLIVPRGKTFMIKPLTFSGPCKSYSISFLVIYSTVYIFSYYYIRKSNFYVKSALKRLSIEIDF